MTPSLELIGGADAARAWLAVALDAAIKGSVILSLGLAIAGACRRASASIRHLTWALALAGLMIVPVVSAAFPRWRLRILPRPALGAAAWPATVAAAKPAPYRADVDPARIALGRAPLISPGLPEGSAATENARVIAPPRWLAVVLVAWVAGALGVIARLVVGLATVRNRGCRAMSVTSGPWLEMVAEIAAEYRIRRRIALRVSAGAAMPATWGVWHPVVLLPAEALDWRTDRLRTVLMHELAHVARWDFATQTLARVACALHWFNPLAWLADRRLRIASESASDDLVLGAGLRASEYASQLVAVLIAARRARGVPTGAMAMARASGLEGRLRAILDRTRPRRALSNRRAALMVSIAVSLILSLGIVRLEARAHDVPKIDRLPDGVSVEVIGVSTHPSGPKTWWAPDGTPLAEAPCDPAPDDARVTGRPLIEIVARITGLPKGSTLQWHPTECRSGGTLPPLKGGKASPGLQRCIAKFSQDTPTCVVVFDLAVGSWTMEQAHGGTGVGVEKGDRAYFFGRARETKSGTAIAIAHNITNREVRVVAVDVDGVERSATSASWGGAGHLMMLDLDFDLPPSRIREYQLKSRPMGRFEIKNVALRPRKAAE